jgi:small subunit ribosomal protein S20
LANHKSALKRIRSSKRKQERNRIVRSRTRTYVKKARQTLDGGNLAEAREAILAAVSELDKAATKGVLHKNNVARRKSRLMKKLAKLESAQ